MICNLANKILQIEDWDPTKSKNPDQKLNIIPKFCPHYNPLRPTKPMVVVLPIKDNDHAFHLGKIDCYLDDIITVMLDCPSSIQRWSTAAPLAVFLSLQPHTGNNKPIPRKPGLSPAKLKVKGTPVELQVVLGWNLNTRLLIICLPLDKFNMWTKDI